MSSSIMRWRPFRELATMQNMLDRMFEETWKPLMEDGWPNTLAVDVHEDDQNYTVVTELPGVKPDDIHVRMDGDVLVIDAEIPEQIVEQKEDSQTIMKERRYGKFARRVRLPQRVDSGKVDARYEKGVLTLILPKVEEARPKSIPIKVSAK